MSEGRNLEDQPAEDRDADAYGEDLLRAAQQDLLSVAKMLDDGAPAAALGLLRLEVWFLFNLRWLYRFLLLHLDALDVRAERVAIVLIVALPEVVCIVG